MGCQGTTGDCRARGDCSWGSAQAGVQSLEGYSGRDAAAGLGKVQRGGIKAFHEQNGCSDKEMGE